MKIKLLLFLVIFSVFNIHAQSNKELANHYLNKKGELAFTFTANTIDEIKELSRLISFERKQDRINPLVINAIANKKNFKQFLEFNLPFTVDKKLNEPKDVVMFDPKIHKKGVSSKNEAYTLTFPLTAYPTYAQYAQQMADFAADHPLIAELVDIGGTVQGVGGGDKRLLFIKLSDNVSTREAEPRVMYTSSMHGDEIAGFPMMLSLIDYFITAYNDTGHADHTRVKNLLDNSEVWINPLANPDGTYYNNASNTSVSNAIRGNGNVIDLNRNYPDNIGGAHPDGEVYQTETSNFMTLADDYHFVLSANFHGGTEVVNYPWDNTPDRHSDDDWYFLISKEYAVNCQNDGPSGYMDAMYTDYVWPGVTNGNDWYEVFGGRQDYMNYYQQVRELTLELSGTKLIPASEIENHWNYNREALIEYLIQGTYGFQGVVKDAISGNPIKAKITIVGRDDQALSRNSWVETELFSGTELGDYYRPIKAGTYDILYEADCYTSYTLTNQTITDYQTIVLSDVLLTPVTANVPTNLTASSITTTTATLGWDDVGVTSYDIQYRVDGTSTWINTSSATNSLDLTGLILDTTYEFQVRSVCLSTPSSYSGLSTFKTLAVSYCSAQGNSISYEYISNVQLGGVDSNSQASTSSGYSDYTASVIFPYLDLNSTNNTISVTKYWPGSKFNEAVAVWIDFDRSGTFEVSEKILNSTASKITPITGTFTVPETTILGNTRMRVIMSDNSTIDACGSFSYGEVEDYTVNIFDSTLGIEDEILSEFKLYPNPVKNGEIKLQIPKEITNFNVTISNVLGQKVYQKEVTSNYDNLHKVNTTNLDSGIYFVTVSTNLGKATKKMIIQ